MPPCLQVRRAGPIPRAGVQSTFANPVLTSALVIQTAARLAITPAQVALQWLLQLAPNVVLIPGTGSAAHLRETWPPNA
jgi:aryl-alcohol dehydrogenase-like predicted oxidoreductase